MPASGPGRVSAGHHVRLTGHTWLTRTMVKLLRSVLTEDQATVLLSAASTQFWEPDGSRTVKASAEAARESKARAERMVGLKEWTV